MNIKRTLSATAMTALLAGGLSVGVAPMASATQTSTGCVGTLVQDTGISNSAGTVVAYVEIYWDASTGQNCAMLVSSSATWGISKYMDIHMIECESDTPQRAYDCVVVPGQNPDNGGDFSYYAGPISVNGAGHCIYVEAQVGLMEIPGPYDAGYGPDYTSHC